MTVQTGKKVKVLDYLVEIEKLINDNEEYKSILSDAQSKLLKDLANGKSWMTIEDIPLDKLILDYQVQRYFKVKHAIKTIIKNFDPRVVTLPITVKLSNYDFYSVVDGQHGPTISKILVAKMMGQDTLKCLVVNTDDHTFPGKIFRILNKTGTLQAGEFDILKIEYRDYMIAIEGLKTDPDNQNYRNTINDPTFINAYETVTVFKESGTIDLEPESSVGTKNSGGNDFYFSHIQYARENTALIRVEGMKKVIEAYKKVWCYEGAESKIDNGLFSGMVYLYSAVEKANLSKEFPEDWIEQVYRVLKDNLGDSPEYIHNSCIKAQCKYVTGGSWNTKQHCPTVMRDIFVRCATPEQLQKIVLPFDKKFSEKLRITGDEPDLIESFKFKLKNVV